MAKISLICEQCGGNIILDDSHEIGTCEHCFAQFVVKQDHIVKNIMQNITKYVYGYEGKDVEELLNDGYQLKQLCDDRKANAKFKRAIDLEPNCWSAWLGYASTGGDRSGYLSVVPAYVQAYNVAADEQQETETFVDMTRYLPDSDLRAAFIRAFNLASHADRHKIFELVSGVLGCDESEIASLAVDLCPEDWRAWFAMAKFRKIRAKWAEMQGGFFTKPKLSDAAAEVLNIFMKTYRLACNESSDARSKVLNYIDDLGRDSSYQVFINELKKRISSRQ